MKLRKIIGKTPVRQAFFKLMSANVLVFIFQLISLYLLTKYYSEEAISQFAIFVSITFLCSKLSNLKLFEGILREPDTDKVKGILAASLSLSFVGSILLSLVLLGTTLHGWHFSLYHLDSPALYYLAAATVIHILSSSLMPVVSAYLLKQNAVNHLANGRIIKAIAQVAVLLVYAAESLNNGLILALVVSSVIQLLYMMFSLQNAKFGLASMANSLHIIRENTDIIRYTFPISVLLSVHEFGILQLFAFGFGEAAVATYSLADRIMRLPAQLLGSAANETLYKYGSDTFYKLSPALYFKQFKRGVGRLFGLFVLAALACGVLAYPVLEGLFEDKWLAAAELMQRYAWWIVPFSLVALLRSVPLMLKEQQRYFVLEVIIVLSTLGTLLWASQQADFETALMLKYCVEAVVYSVIIFYIYRMVSKKASEI